jgi:ABC-type Mn2+/Zn2+ transport system ATPase subunit
MSAPVVRVTDASIAREGRAVLEEISFETPPGAFVGVIGPNGAGKTTLLRAILGLVPLSSGSIEVLGRPARERARTSNGIGYVPQRHAFPPDFPARALDVVRLGRMHQRESRAREREAAEEALKRVGIGELAARPVGRLSGGVDSRAASSGA